MIQTNLKGRTAARYLKSLAVAAGDVNAATAYALGQRWLDAAAVVQSLKAAIAPMGTSIFPLPSPAAVDFAEYVRPLTILGRLQGLRRVPSRVRLIAATSGSTAFWSGESQPRPISKLALAGETLEPLSVIAIVVNTRELFFNSNPSAENILRTDLGKAATAAADSAFIDPDNAGENLVMPASVLSGETPRASTGSALANVDADLDATIQALSDAGSDLQNATWIMLPRTARLRRLTAPPAPFSGRRLFRISIDLFVSAASPHDSDTINDAK